ncbi:TonB-dependent receptor plug domain-containing protein [Dyadobacter psychrotolerans]|uniref:TonB-dependent receptor plug domain-containing protein n=1 Tax=Dyadobacter psychrotolerans TaxID=2541721 RepID=UPI001E28BE51|nr:TonB-dependent receptor plug domain-containing protein [Dyadobacter psychrotolerans]
MQNFSKKRRRTGWWLTMCHQYQAVAQSGNLRGKVTGYQSHKKEDLTGAVSVVRTSDIKDVPLSNLIKALQGRIPGVYITTNGSPAVVQLSEYVELAQSETIILCM